MEIIRFIKAFAGMRDKYRATIDCTKPLNETLDFIRSYMEKGSTNTGKLYHGDFVIAKDVNMGTYYQIEKQVQDLSPMGQVKSVMEEIIFRINYIGCVATRVDMDIQKTTCSKKVFDEFVEDFKAIKDIELTEENTKPAPKLDLSEKTMAEALDIFEKAVKKFGNEVNKTNFEALKEVKAEIEKKIDDMPITDRTKYSKNLAQIDTFIGALNMQFSNPATASQVQNFAGTYVSQMKSEIAEMISNSI